MDLQLVRGFSQTLTSWVSAGHSPSDVSQRQWSASSSQSKFPVLGHSSLLIESVDNQQILPL